MGGTIKSEYKILIKKSLKLNYRIVAAAGCKVFMAHPSPNVWSDRNLVGALVLCLNRKLSYSPFLCLIDLNNGNIIWMQEIYMGMPIFCDSKCFYSFPGDISMIGLAFANQIEGEQMIEIIQKQMKDSFSSLEISNDLFIKNKKDKKSSKKYTAQSISAPLSVRRVSHLGLDNFGKINAENIPREWLESLKNNQSISINKKEISNNEINKEMNIMNSKPKDIKIETKLKDENFKVKNDDFKVAKKSDKNQKELKKKKKEKELKKIPSSPIPPPIPPRLEKKSNDDKKLKDPLILTEKIKEEEKKPQIDKNTEIRSALMSDIRNTKVSMLKKVPKSKSSKKSKDKLKSEAFNGLLQQALEHRRKSLNFQSDDEQIKI